jgi:hypothetical protein
MKIRMTRSYEMWESYEPIEINPEDYPELEGMSEDEILEYLNENMYEFEIKDGSEGTLVDEIMFGKDIIKDKMGDETFTLYLED